MLTSFEQNVKLLSHSYSFFWGCDVRNRFHLVYLSKLLFAFLGQMVTDKDKRQVGIVEQTLLNDISILLIQCAGSFIHQ